MPWRPPAANIFETLGTAKTYAELLKHRWAIRLADQTAIADIFASLFPGIPQNISVVMRTNVACANYWAVTKGVGIGLFPAHGFALGTKLVPINLGLQRSLDIWLTRHPDSNRIPRFSNDRC
jgi:hypothetical protein